MKVVGVVALLGLFGLAMGENAEAKTEAVGEESATRKMGDKGPGWWESEPYAKKQRNQDRCLRTVPREIRDVLRLVDDTDILRARDILDDVCCVASGLRAELGYDLVDVLIYNFTNDNVRDCPGPYIPQEGVPFNWFEGPFDLRRRRLEGAPEAAGGSGRFRRPSTFGLYDDFAAVLAEVSYYGNLEDALEALDYFSQNFLNFDLFSDSVNDLEELLLCLDLRDGFLDGNLGYGYIPSYEEAPSIGVTQRQFCNIASEFVGYAFLSLTLPWLMPACHCHYRQNVGCGFDDCWQPNPDSCDGCSAPERALEADKEERELNGGRLFFPFKTDAYIPKLDVYQDFLVGSQYWRSPKTGRATGQDFANVFGPVRACRGRPKEVYFDAYLGVEFDPLRGTPLFPDRRDGNPFNECLGFCYMYGVQDNSPNFCGAFYDE